MTYRCVACSVEGFVQQLAVSYIGQGYWFYVAGHVPEPKDPGTVDRKLIARYGIDISKWARARRKRAGLANVQYLRFERFFVLLATTGIHAFFSAETTIRDARVTPIHFRGYSIGYGRDPRGQGHPSVRIHPTAYRDLKAYLLELALRRSDMELASEFRRIPFEPYAPIRSQLLAIWRAVNGLRATNGLGLLPASCIRMRRRPVQVFSPEASHGEPEGKMTPASSASTPAFHAGSSPTSYRG